MAFRVEVGLEDTRMSCAKSRSVPFAETMQTTNQSVCKKVRSGSAQWRDLNQTKIVLCWDREREDATLWAILLAVITLPRSCVTWKVQPLCVC